VFVLLGAAAVACGPLVNDPTLAGDAGQPDVAQPADAQGESALAEASLDASSGDGDEGSVVSEAACNGDLTSDPNNCGTCGHACRYGACALGRCESWLVSNAGSVAQLAADTNYVAWSDGSGLTEISLSKTPVDRSGASLFAGAGVGPAFGAGSIAWLSPGLTVVVSPEAMGGAGMPQASLPAGTVPSHFGLSSDGTTAYFLAPSAGGVDLFGCPLTGMGSTCSSLKTVAPTGSPGALAVTSHLVFSLVNAGTSSTIICYDVDIQQANLAFQTGTNFGVLARDDTYLYWTSGVAPNIAINQIGQDGGPVQMVASALTETVQALDTDGTNVYYSTGNGTSATLWSAPIGGGATPVRLYQTSEPAGAIPAVVAAGGAVYFADVAGGSPATSKILGIVPPP
jgi:hypothetical protein